MISGAYGGVISSVSVKSCERDEKLELGTLHTEMGRKWDGRKDMVLLGDIVIRNMAGLRGCRALVLKHRKATVISPHMKR